MSFSIGAWLAICSGLGAILLWTGRRRAGRMLVSLGTLGFVAIMVLPVDQWALMPLENRFTAPPADLHLDGIIVLGGALESALTADRGIPSLNGAAERLTAFIAQARLHPEAKLVFTGGPLPSRPDGPPEALGVRQLLDQLGFPTERVIFEPLSRTTWENAVFAHALIQPKPGERWMMITSAAHMPRAIGAFRHMGWDMLAFPVGYKTFAHASNRIRRGFGERMMLLDIAAHEWIGLAVYWLRGDSSALFPAPEPTLAAPLPRSSVTAQAGTP